MEIKKCTKCKELLEISCFYKKGKKNNGDIRFRSDCKKCFLSKIDKSDRSEYAKKYVIENREKHLQAQKNYRDNNYDKISEYNKKNKDASLKRNKKHYLKYKSNELYILKRRLRDSIRRCFKYIGTVKNRRSEETLGCSIEFFKEYIESKFTDGMTWDNNSFYGWHLDHIIPLDSAKVEEDVIRLSHYTNFQPLWALDNLKKSNKLPPNV
tara:strand:+ start:171 stop:800 length:630 start_codon:yes stop_codon:yes gene_type:complete